MADTEVDDVDIEEPEAKSSKDQQSSKQDLERVTGFSEDKELDTTKAEQSVKNLLTRNNKIDEARVQREKELASVSIKSEDIDLLVQEMEISKVEAEKVLREHKGEVVAALSYLIST